jgi:hypothetical protein
MSATALSLFPTLAAVLFWAGVFLLAWLVSAAVRVQGLARHADRTWADSEEAFARRSQNLPNLLQDMQDVCPLARTTALARAAEQTIITPEGGGNPDDRALRITREQEISRLLALVLSEYTEQVDPHGAWQEHEAQIADLREQYNEAARAVAAARRSLRVGLVARALLPEDLPLFR